MSGLKEKIEELEKRLGGLFSVEKIDKAQSQLRQLEAKSLKSDFWTDTQSASETMQKIAGLKEEWSNFQDISTSLSTIKGLSSLGEGSDLNLEEELAVIEKKIETAETLSFLSGDYDESDAILSIHSGQGGVEAMDWAAMLLRMYLRYAESKNWGASLINETKGEEAGIKEASLEMKGRYAYGLLRREAGTHRLVRQSPFNADQLRQTSFALVEVLPVLPPEETKQISPEEIEIEAFRASGPGGQNVQKVNSAVRLRHLPTGIVVTAQSERSQLQNRQNAMKLLAAKLYLLEEAKKTETKKELKGVFKQASWGNQIRSYVLHPYKQVKDLRTAEVSTDPDSVLAGGIEPFIEAELKLKN